VNPDRTGNRPVGECDIAATCTVVHLENYGMVKGFQIISKDGTAEYWATNDLEMNDLGRFRLAEASWKIEEFHSGLKQVTNVFQHSVGSKQSSNCPRTVQRPSTVRCAADRTKRFSLENTFSIGFKSGL